MPPGVVGFSGSSVVVEVEVEPLVVAAGPSVLLSTLLPFRDASPTVPVQRGVCRGGGEVAVRKGRRTQDQNASIYTTSLPFKKRMVLKAKTV